ncbi:hypothetical protein [Winogradskyella sediminis]|uniref:hypothetical protein n=1 Tax=Winogradskyella sediminis TaxID=1382466 RepID=UPI003AA9BABB
MDSIPHMVSRGKEPLKVFKVNSTYILGVYKGSLSEFDLLLKYRQKDDASRTGWSRIRTPKHIHWAVDVLIKMNEEYEKTNEFLKFLIEYWNEEVVPIKSIIEQNNLLSDALLIEIEEESKSYTALADKGEYSVKFLLLIAKLLMFQEKTNLHTAYMFKNLLVSLKEGKDIFKIVSIATHR